MHQPQTVEVFLRRQANAVFQMRLDSPQRQSKTIGQLFSIDLFRIMLSQPDNQKLRRSSAGGKAPLLFLAARLQVAPGQPETYRRHHPFLK